MIFLTRVRGIICRFLFFNIFIMHQARSLYLIRKSLTNYFFSVNVFNFECGHNIPRSKSGKTDINNLFPICTRCNKSMSNKWTIDEWNEMDFDKPKVSRKRKRRSCCPFF